MNQRRAGNLDALLEERASLYPDKEFLIEEPGGRVFTYSSFDRAVTDAARTLARAGVDKGDRVALLLSNRAEYLIFYFACFKIGAWAGPINSLLRPAEIAFILSDSGASVAVTEGALYHALDEARATAPLCETILVVDRPDASSEGKSLDAQRHPIDVADAYRPQGQSDPDDEAVLIYTSGTTGKPKGVMLSHSNLLVNAREIAEWLELSDRDRALMVMPLFHANALMTTGLAALWAGASIVISPKFSASRHWQTVATLGVTYFGSVATMLSILNNTHPRGMPEGISANRLRFALCGSAPVPVEVMLRFERLFSCPVIEGYGLSESTCRSTFNPIEGRRPGSAGLPIGNEVKIFDDQDRELPADKTGEIVLRGANITKGYYHNEEATRWAFRSGWFHSGDLGYMDAHGFVYIVDRKSDMIIRGGENIYPREIDEILYQHPAVSDAATIGVADAIYGEEVKAYVVLREGARASEKELIEFCRQSLAGFKCPKSIEFLDEIPKGPTGKLLKRELASRQERQREPESDIAGGRNH